MAEARQVRLRSRALMETWKRFDARRAPGAWLVVAALAASAGCSLSEWDSYRMQVRDPRQVALAGQGATLGPEGAPVAPHVVIEDMGRQFEASREADGSLRLMTWTGGEPAWETLVDAGGAVTPRLRTGQPPFWTGERVRAPVCQNLRARDNCRVLVELVTPRDNVIRLTRTTQPPRTPAIYLGIVGLLLGSVGALLLDVGAHTPPSIARTQALGAGAATATLGTVGLALAGWIAFTPTRNDVLVGH